HPPLTQLAVPLVVEQAPAQLPQWSRSLLRLTSQPFATFPSQLAKPALQVIVHCDETHAAVPFVALQPAPQAPQFATLFVVLTSQPFAALPSQLAKPASQAPTWHI